MINSPHTCDTDRHNTAALPHTVTPQMTGKKFTNTLFYKKKKLRKKTHEKSARRFFSLQYKKHEELVHMQVTEILRALSLSEIFLIKTRVLTHASNHQHKHVQIHFYVHTHLIS